MTVWITCIQSIGFRSNDIYRWINNEFNDFYDKVEYKKVCRISVQWIEIYVLLCDPLSDKCIRFRKQQKICERREFI